jgi:hypothetical protein
MRILHAAALLICLPTAAFAQEKLAFTGLHAGPEAGVVIHGLTLGDDDNAITYKTTGLAGGGFAGWMLPASNRLRLGGEVAVHGGGGTARSQQVFAYAEQKATWGYSLTARAGYVLSQGTMIFAEAGYGGYRFDGRTSSNLIADGSLNETNGLVAGIGIEQRLNRTLSVRLRGQVGESHGRIMLGLPIRF